MKAFLIGLMPSLIFVGTIVPLCGLFYWLSSRRKDRRSPLTRQLLRGPGHSLTERIEDLTITIDGYALSIATAPLCLYASYISGRYFGVTKTGDHTAIIYVLILFGAAVFLMVKLRRLLKERADARLGLDCEIAVGQELNGLMCEGYKVYHDIPGNNFNVDHVVVGPNGVFAVETEGRSKPNRGRGQSDATVVYDGRSLTFPDSVKTEGKLDGSPRG